MEHVQRNDTDAGLLTIAEIAKHYSLPESTARFYCKRFLDYLPHMGEGKRRRYRQEVLEIFAVVIAEMKKRKNAGAVEATLAAKFPRNIELQALQPQAAQAYSNTAIQSAGAQPALIDFSQVSTVIQNQGEALNQIATALQRLVDNQEDVKSLRKQLVERDTEVVSLRKDLENLKSLQQDAENMHHDDIQSLRKWLSQLAGKAAG